MRGHPWPVDGSTRLRAAGRVTARDGPPVVSWLSWKVGCRDAPSNHPGDNRLRAQGGDGVDPRGCGGGSPDGAGGSRVLPRGCRDGCVDGVAISLAGWDVRFPASSSRWYAGQRERALLRDAQITLPAGLICF